MEVLSILSLISSAELSFTNMSYVDRRPALREQDDWVLYFDRSSLVEKPCEFLCVTLVLTRNLQTFMELECNK